MFEVHIHHSLFNVLSYRELEIKEFPLPLLSSSVPKLQVHLKRFP